MFGFGKGTTMGTKGDTPVGGCPFLSPKMVRGTKGETSPFVPFCPPLAELIRSEMAGSSAIPDRALEGACREKRSTEKFSEM
jgi:hypothetical protein